MFYLVLTGVVFYMAYTYKEGIAKTVSFTAESRLKSKLMIPLFLVTTFLLIFPELVPENIAPVAYGYMVLILGYQAFSIYKTGKEFKVPWPEGSTTNIICAFLVLWTPLGDLVLGRSYESKAGFAIAAASLAFLLLYMIEVFQRNQDFFSAEKDSE